MLARLLPVALLAALCGCSKPTEIVVRLVVPGTPPPYVLVKLHRTIPFNDNPASTPGWVQSSLNGADLDLTVLPQGHDTLISLLPAKGGGNDLRVTVSAPGYTVSPAAPQDVEFVEDQSKELRFELSEPPPDGGVKDGPARDLSLPRDGGADASSPVDLANRG